MSLLARVSFVIICTCLSLLTSYSVQAQNSTFLRTRVSCLGQNPGQEMIEWSISQAPFNLSAFHIRNIENTNEAVFFYQAGTIDYAFLDISDKTVFFLIAVDRDLNELARFGPFAPCVEPVSVTLSSFKVEPRKISTDDIHWVLTGIAVILTLLILHRKWNYTTVTVS